MKEPNTQLKKSYRSVNLHKFGQTQELVRINKFHTNIYLYVHICVTNAFENESVNPYYIIKYLALSSPTGIYLPTEKLDIDIMSEYLIQLNPNTTLHICKMQTLTNPNLLAYKICYMYLEKSDSNISTIKKFFESKPFYYTSGLNQKKLIKYTQDEIDNLETLFDNITI